MLKTRLIPCIITKNELVVQSFNFHRYLPIGNIRTAIEFFSNWDVDEIMIIDIDASKEGRSPNVKVVDLAVQDCFIPLTVGGGIKTIADIHSLLNAGADKVCLNRSAVENPAFVTESARLFGNQCITVSIDAIATEQGYKTWDYVNQRVMAETPAELARKMESYGAGEILLNSVDRDGSRLGYDVELLQSVTQELKIPVIACGGVGHFDHLSDGALKGGAQAVAAANIFQHTEHSTIAAKSHLLRSGVDVRLSSAVKYKDFEFDALGRPY
ncbi:imidazole glycerol phosphate synthase subunit HisF [Marinomonas piezotolerans]|uniref:imidazole glycerol-phosphate synthase n=1 Tax=Marinomonas piezotolerans TaxID=2213058 RepID=A0A370U8C2_9GAMM|nr:HisA/HisF-related TIM barrel protein [Marinomonas piezotolerans]RDL44024.1 imidazole glycerol phosphate synthase subunit HisF [Marinomonas piezotolerans]